MPKNTITIKPNNHRIHPVYNAKKSELLEILISQNSDASILVCTNSPLQNNIDLKNVVVKNDEELSSDTSEYQLVINLDIPKPEAYIARVAKATDKAITLVDESEQKDLYPIEMLLGRAIKQENIEGFAYEVIIKEEPDRPVRKPLSKEQIKEVAKKRYDEKVGEPKEKKEYEKREPSKWDKKDKKPNQFLGKDENGKAKFSGKSGERNHKYDGTPKERYGAPKKVGKKINIKALKPKDSE